MKRWGVPSSMLLCAVLIPLGYGNPMQYELAIRDKTPALTALSHATLVIEPGTIIEDATLLLQGERILGIDENNQIPAAAKEINLSGYTIYPGFIDSYTQYGVTLGENSHAPSPIYEIESVGAQHANPAVRSDINWFEHFKAEPDTAKNWLKNGFTSVHSHGQDGIFRGQGFVSSLATASSHELLYQSHSGHWLSFDKGSSPLEYPNSLMGAVALIRQTLADSQWYSTHQHKQTGNTQTSLLALQNHKDKSIWFASQHPQDPFIAQQLLGEFELEPILLGSGLEFENLNQVSDAQWILPLKFAAKPSLEHPLDHADISVRQLRHWERSPGNAAALAAAEIPFALTQHGIEPEQFWPRLRKAMSHGLQADDALAALTTVPAAMLGLDQRLGRLAKGYQADLVISQGDLFTNGSLHGLVLRGEFQPLHSPSEQAYQGEYELELDQHQLILTFEQDAGKLSGLLEQGEGQIPLTELKLTPFGLGFRADLTPLGFPGISQLYLQQQAQGLSGEIHFADGQQRSVIARPQPKPVDPPSEAPPEPVHYLSRQTQPNVAYGRAEAPLSQALHIRNATVWTSTEAGVLTDSDVLIQNGRILAIGPQLKTPKGFQTLDASGKHLTAGIVDEHSHIALRGGVNEASENITSEVRIGDVLDPTDIHIYRALAGGVTTAQLLHGSANPIGGQAQTIKLRWGESAQGLKFQQAPASIKLALGENVKQSNWGDQFTERYPQTRMGVDALLRDAFVAAKEYRQAQQQYAQLRRSAKRDAVPPRPNYRLDAIAEILEGQRHIHVHSYVQSEILALLELAQEQDFHVQTFTHVLEGYKLAPELAVAGSSASTFADWWAYKFEVFDAIPHNACLMTEQGVLTSINSDSRDLIRRLNQEAAKSMMYCDMSAEQAWAMITINPAKQLKIDHLVGSIEIGKHADLVLWNASPLSVYARAETTWVDGKPYFSRVQDRLERHAIAAERQALLQKALADDEADPFGQILTPEPTPGWHCDTLGQHSHHVH
ncbi:amidohydrolase family protein [Ferrimonas pelagia]|uniref:Amidohydrolase family protein n=1 Tax=Ferrimonas pelagia TaxID=1177826 RepID=A0ABP9EB19_9GAMM